MNERPNTTTGVAGARAAAALLALACLAAAGARAGAQDAGPDSQSRPAAPPASPETRPASLEETRLAMAKWTETQQIISKERREWQQGREILLGRVELVKQEVATLDDKIQQAQSGVAESEKKKSELLAENEKLKAATAQVTLAVTGMEADVKRLFPQLPEPVRTKVQTFYDRIPADPETTKVSVAERFQNVLGILNEANKANTEITVNYEIHTLADGKPSEVKVIYVGLAQAYYLSGRGEAGIGRPTPEGWTWMPGDKALARELLTTLEILENKHVPAFVPLPVKIQ
jgi:hypothetical protein